MDSLTLQTTSLVMFVRELFGKLIALKYLINP